MVFVKNNLEFLKYKYNMNKTELAKSLANKLLVASRFSEKDYVWK